MPTRIINRPNDITLKPPVEGASVDSPTFADFVRQLLNHPVWGSDYRHVRMACAIEDAITRDPIRLAEEDWSKLKEVAEKPPGQTSYGYQPWVMRQLLPYLEAIIGAEVEKAKAD